MKRPVVGIDLGTTNTVVGVVAEGQALALGDADGRRLIPSVVAFLPDGDVLVGHGAKPRRADDPRNTIYSIKRLIGRSWSSDEVREARARFPFEMREGPGNAALVVARRETYTLPEISAFVLRKAKQVAEAALGTPIERAVVTVPANFNDLQRAATKVAGRVAGLEVMRILNEPTAAALAYGYGRGRNERIAVYDFGGGTFDVTLLDLAGDVFEVLATAGNTFLGGDDIDLAIADRMADELFAEQRYDARAHLESFERLRAAAEVLKIELSQEQQATVRVEDVAPTLSGHPISFTFAMSRSELNQLASFIVDRTFDVCREALGIARLEAGSFDQVLMVGGTTRMPLVQDRVEQFFRRQPLAHISPDEVVAIGAAIQAAALSGPERRRASVPPPPAPAAPAELRRLSGPPVRPPGAGPVAEPSSRGYIGQAPRSRMPTGLGLGPPAALMSAGEAALRQRIKETSDELAPLPPLPLVGVGPSPASAAPPGLPLVGGRRGAEQEGDDEVTAVGLEAATEPMEDELTQRVLAPSSLPPLPLVGGPSPAAARSGEVPALVPLGKPPLPRPPPSARPHGPDPSLPAVLGGTRPPPARPTSATPGDAPWMASGASPVTPELSAATTQPAGVRTMPMAAIATAPAPLPSPSALHGSVASSSALAPPLFTPMQPVTSPVRPLGERAPLLVDVTPLSLTVETVGGFCDAIITRNSTVPCERTRTFATAVDGQTSVRVRVAQGESPHFLQNTLLGELELSELRSGPRGAVQIAVSFQLDIDGILDVTAKDIETGRSATARVRLVGLSEGMDVESMTERHAARRTL